MTTNLLQEVPVTVEYVTGVGGGRCHGCKARCDYLWCVRYSDNTWASFCSNCCPGVGDIKVNRDARR